MGERKLARRVAGLGPACRAGQGRGGQAGRQVGRQSRGGAGRQAGEVGRQADGALHVRSWPVLADPQIRAAQSPPSLRSHQEPGRK